MWPRSTVPRSRFTWRKILLILRTGFESSLNRNVTTAQYRLDLTEIPNSQWNHFSVNSILSHLSLLERACARRDTHLEFKETVEVFKQCLRGGDTWRVWSQLMPRLPEAFSHGLSFSGFSHCHQVRHCPVVVFLLGAHPWHYFSLSLSLSAKILLFHQKSRQEANI